MDIHRDWIINPDLCYLNHAAVSPWPKRTRDAISQFAQENAERGAQRYPQWLAREQSLRSELGRLINAESKDAIGLLKNTSEGLSVIAYGLPWQSGDNIVISNQEFPSNRIVWESLRQYGVEVRIANLSEHESPEQTLISACDRNTRLLAISSVQYATGLMLNLASLGEHCRAHDILYCVDAIQSLGAVPFDVRAIGADFVAADGHKWMLGPEGLALFYCKPELRDRLSLKQYGWHMVEDAGNYDRQDWQIASSARRFECGSPNMLGVYGLHASLSLLLEIGIERVHELVIASTRYLAEQLRQIPNVEVVTPTETGRYAGIMSFRTTKGSPTALFKLLQEQQVICALRGGAIRFSPHYYTEFEQMDRALDIVRDFSA